MIIKWGESVKVHESKTFFSPLPQSLVLRSDAKSTPLIAHKATPHLVESTMPTQAWWKYLPKTPFRDGYYDECS